MNGGGRSARPGGVLDWKALLGLAISGVLLWLAFRQVDLSEVAAHVRAARPGWFLAAVFAATVVFPIRAMRWRPLLRPVHPGTSFQARFAATNIGFMANNLLPARVGEFARAYALTRLEPIRVSASFGSLVVERLFDGVTLVTSLLIVAAWPTFPELTPAGADVRGIAVLVGLLFLAGLAVLLALVLWPERSVAVGEAVARRLLPRAVRRPVVDALEAFLDGVAVLRSPALVARVAAWSVLLWGVGAVGFWLAFRAFGIGTPFLGAIFLQALIALAVALPSAPGFFGVYEAAAYVGLVQVWGVEASQALAFAIGFHIGGFVPVTLIGLYYVWRLGLTWRDVGESEERVEAAVESDPAHRGAIEPR